MLHTFKLEFHGTDSDTLGMRLSCNFVNMYTIAYRVQYTFTRVHARIPTDILAGKSARVGQVGGQVGEVRRACPARGKLNGKVGEDVRVGVGVGIGPMEFQLYTTQGVRCEQTLTARTRCFHAY